ncbi:hypothetical protein C6N75_18005 [Streptomyces solincola]|uniref:PASTA domain-containing protein n=1 Tax=Streptomyces solincola TaxID=2100817 RepID=A0A2S9PU12_9ACTN|nr:hypothetical protein C6N75_18005 [Streptomyces solincola]
MQKPKMGTGKKVGIGCGGALGLLLIIGMIGAAVDGDTNTTTSSKPAAASSPTATEKAAPAPTVTVTKTAAPPAVKPSPTPTAKPPKAAPAAETSAPTNASLPNLVGMDLQAAQDSAQAAGFFILDDQDASGQGRLQVMDRNWTVCSQQPTAGEHPADTKVILYAVKDFESC